MHMEMGDMSGMVAASIFPLSMVTIMPELPSKQVILQREEQCQISLSAKYVTDEDRSVDFTDILSI